MHSQEVLSESFSGPAGAVLAAKTRKSARLWSWNPAAPTLCVNAIKSTKLSTKCHFLPRWNLQGCLVMQIHSCAVLLESPQPTIPLWTMKWFPALWGQPKKLVSLPGLCRHACRQVHTSATRAIGRCSPFHRSCVFDVGVSHQCLQIPGKTRLTFSVFSRLGKLIDAVFRVRVKHTFPPHNVPFNTTPSFRGELHEMRR